MKSFRKALSLLLALVLLLGMAPMGIPAHAAGTVSFTMDGFYDYEQAAQVLARINEARADNNMAPLTADKAMTELAMTRAAEFYVYGNSAQRPDGRSADTLLSSSNASSKLILCDLSADGAAFTSKCCSVLVTDPDLSSVAIGCFRQNEDIASWVLLSTSDSTKTPFSGRGSLPAEVTIHALPSNLGGDLLHHSFSNAYCACYLYEGTTIGTGLQLRNLEKTSVIITPKDIDYGCTTTDDSVFTFDNDAHTITALAPGKARLGITIDGQPIPTVSNDADVEVFEVPALTCEQQDDEIHVGYAGFPSTVSLYIKGTKDDTWMMGNREADLIYEHRNIDLTETYTYVMRYWDKWLEDWVVIGEPLVVQLGDSDPEPTPTPTPTPTPAPEGLWLPTEADLPLRTSEPSLDEVTEILHRLKTEVYPQFTDWPYKTTYRWQGGKFTLADGSSYDTAQDEAAFAFVVSDLIFGKLPARLDYDIAADDLRPGDIFCDNYGSWYIVQDISPLYLTAAKIGSPFYPDAVIWDSLYPTANFRGRINYVLTRYTSQAPGSAALHPTIVPADAEILAGQTNSTYINSVYTAVIRWTLTTDGTLYLEGIGRPGYSGDGWKSYKDQIKTIVFGNGVTGVLPETFAGYKALEAVVLSDTVAEISGGTFSNCSNLKSITFAEGLTSIDENAFEYCGLESLVLPDTLEALGDYAFSSCAKLKSLYVPASITQWGRNCFTSCDALEELTLEEGLTTLGYSAFNHLDSLKTISIPGSLKTIPKNAFYFSKAEALYIASGVEVIDEYAFGYCKQLKEIHLPNTLTQIEDDVFRDCDKVTDVYFYGTEAQFRAITVGTSNDCLAGDWWSLVTIHFLDPNQCRHTNVTAIAPTAPTCTEQGLTEGTLCADCGQVLTEQKPIPPLGHQYERTEYTAPTCIEAGSAKYVCANDPSHSYEETLEPTNVHSYKDGSCIHCGKAEPVVIENPFTDVNEGDWFYGPVLWAKSSGITGGKTETTFAPNEGCTRAQVVTFLWAANGKPTPTKSFNPFTDVDKNAWYANAVLWAVERGITGGTSDTTFSPDATCTRAQIATFLYAAAGKPPVSGGSSFIDVAASDWYAAPVSWAVEHKVTSGIGGGKFGPNDICTRAQVVTFLMQVYQ